MSWSSKTNRQKGSWTKPKPGAKQRPAKRVDYGASYDLPFVGPPGVALADVMGRDAKPEHKIQTAVGGRYFVWVYDPANPEGEMLSAGIQSFNDSMGRAVLWGGQWRYILRLDPYPKGGQM